ncbi:MAG: glycosyltransferase [Patescibacteria group bacterium]
MEGFSVIVLVPCVNEAGSIRATLQALMAQTRKPDGIIVGDHNSTDGTGEIARTLGVTVVTCQSPIKRKGANLQNMFQSQEFRQMVGNHPRERVIVVIIDGDTIVDQRGLENLVRVFEDPQVTSASGYVLPAKVNCIWQKARLFEYHLSLNLHKRIQAGFGSSLVCSGCFAGIRLNVLLDTGGFGIDLSEDLILTWEQLTKGQQVRFVPEALCYTQEPTSLGMVLRQLDRWGRGFFQGVAKYKRQILSFTNPSFSIFVLFWLLEGIIAPFLPLITLITTIKFGLGFLKIVVIVTAMYEFAITVMPAAIGSYKHGHLLATMCSLPYFSLLRLVAMFAWWRAMWKEWIVREHLPEWHKGH